MTKKHKQVDTLVELLAVTPSGVIADLLVDVLKNSKRWRSFAVKVKQDNIKRPAFQDEFANVASDWRGL